MKTVHFAFTLLALSMVAAFPLIGESFAQTNTSITATAKVTGPNEISVMFSEPVDASKPGFSPFTLAGGTLADGTLYSADGVETTRQISTVNNSGDFKTWIIKLQAVRGQDLGTDATGNITINPTATDGTVVTVVKDRTSNNYPLEELTPTGQVTDGQSPQIKSVKIIDNSGDPLRPQVEIVYTESVTILEQGLANYSYKDLNVRTVTVNAATHTLTLSGSPLPPDATGFLTFKPTFSDADPPVATGLMDVAGNVLVTTNEHPLVDHPVEAGQIPTVESAKFTGAHTLEVTFSETIQDVTADNFTNLILNDGTTRNPSSFVHANAVSTLTYSGDNIPTGATGMITIQPIFNTDDPPVATSLRDAAFNPVKAEIAFPIMDEQPPMVVSKSITGPNELTIEFSESVRLNLKSFGAFTVGSELDSRDLSNLRGNGTNIIKLTVDGDEIPTNVSGTFAAIVDNADGSVIAGVTDLVNPKPNPMAPYTDVAVAPGQTPTIKSAMIVNPTQVKIQFSEDITAFVNATKTTTVTAYVTFYKNNDRDPLNGTAEIGSDDADTITFTRSSGEFVPKDTGRVTITNDIVSNTNDGVGGNTLLKFKGVVEYPVEAGQIPTVKSVMITGGNEITVTFSEAVYATDENFTKFTLTGGKDITPGDTRTLSGGVSSVTNPVTNYDAFVGLTDSDTLEEYETFTMTVSDDDLPTDATGTVRIASIDNDGTSTDSLFDKDNIAVSTTSRYDVTDGQSPNLISAKLTTPNEITIKFTERIKASWPDFTNLLVNESKRNISGIIGSVGSTITSDTVNLGILGNGISSDVGAITVDIAPHGEDDEGMPISLIDLAGNPLKLTMAQMTGADAVQKDGADRADDDFEMWPVKQGQIPTLMSAKITSPTEITLEFSIPVTATTADFTFTLIGESSPRMLSNIMGSGTETITLTVSGDHMAPEAQGTISIAETLIGTNSRATIVALSNEPVMPGQPPTVTLATITDKNKVTVGFSVDVNADKNHFTFTVDGEANSRTIETATSTATGAIELTLEGDDMSADATGKINISGVKNANTDVTMKPVTNVNVFDAQAPTVMSAKITDNNMLTIKFTERVNTTLSDYDNFMLTAGTGITPNEPRGLSNITHPTGDTVKLVIDGANLPVDAEGVVTIRGNIIDLSNNMLVAIPSQPVSAGQIPEALSAMFTGPGVITVKFSEPVVAQTDDFRAFKVTSFTDGTNNTPRNIVAVTNSESDAINILVSGPFALDTEAEITVKNSVRDLANPPNTLVADVVLKVDADARPMIESAAITGPNEIVIEYSEPVTSSNNDYVGLMITYTADDDEEITNSVNIASMTGSGTNTATLTVRETIPEDATGSIVLYPSKFVIDPSGDKMYKSLVDNRNQLLAELIDENDEVRQSHTLTLKDGQENMETATFADIRGKIYADNNGNGMMDANEDGISTTITISETPERVISSGSSGDYTITHVIANDYTLMVQVPSNYYDTTSDSTRDVTVVGGTNINNENFGLKPLVTVTGTVFDDANDNQMQDEGESGISGATVSINTTPAKTVMTDIDGMYTIDTVPAGSYTLTVTQSDYADIAKDITAMGGATADNTEDFALGSVGMITGTVSDNMDMGIVGVSVSISGITNPVMTNDMGVYSFDSVPTGPQTITITVPENYIGDNTMSVTVGSGSNDPVNFTLTPVGTVMGTVSNSANNEGISGIMVSITDTELTATTDTDGMYEITNVPTGTYDVMLNVSDGYLGSTSMEVTVSQGVSASVDFELTPVGMVTGMVFSDTNSNGVKDNLETGLAGVTISITDSLTAVTANDGTYTISNVPVGDQVVTVTAPDTHFVEEMATVSVTVTRGSTETANFALVPKTVANTATITGVIFNDVNGDGMQGTNEGGYSIYREMILTNITSGEVVKQDTDDSGVYSFDVLAGNTYTIQTSFFPAGITVLDPDSSWYRENIIPTAGQTVTFDVGFHTVIEGEHSMLDLTVFIDTNRNGVMDEGETGQPLVFTVYTYTIGPANVTTDAQGKLLLNLVPADWAITGLPAGYAPTLYSYERDDATEGKNYASNVLVADDPEKGSTHTMMIGLVPTS